jgi:hypothetical protein
MHNTLDVAQRQQLFSIIFHRPPTRMDKASEANEASEPTAFTRVIFAIVICAVAPLGRSTKTNRPLFCRAINLIFEQKKPAEF